MRQSVTTRKKNYVLLLLVPLLTKSYQSAADRGKMWHATTGRAILCPFRKVKQTQACIVLGVQKIQLQMFMQRLPTNTSDRSVTGDIEHTTSEREGEKYLYV